jgi:hypothetical protein
MGYLFVNSLLIRKKTNKMEFTNDKSGPAVETANDSLQTQIEVIAAQKVERVKSFREYAFAKAGLNLGDYLYLKTYLKWISDGHLVDDTYNENEQHLLKQQVKNKIQTTDDEKEKLEGEKRTAVEVSRPSVEKKIKELNDEIQQTRIDLAENYVQTRYQPEKYFMYAGLTIVLSFLFAFFLCLSNLCFFF